VLETRPNVLMGRLMAIPDTNHYFFEQIVRSPCWPEGDGGWLQQEATREYNQIQQAAYADPNKLIGYLDLYSCDNPVSTPRPRWWCRFGRDRTRSFSATSRLMAIIALQLSESEQRRRSQRSRWRGHRRGRTGKHLLAPTWEAAPTPRSTLTVMPPRCSTPRRASSMCRCLGKPPGWPRRRDRETGAPSNVQFATVSTYSPGVFMVFSYRGAITHADGSPVSGTSPAAANEWVVVYATGSGAGERRDGHGSPASSTSLQPTTRSRRRPCLARFPLMCFSPVYSQDSPVYQVNVQIPANLPSLPPSSISIGGTSAPPVPV